MNIFGFPYHPKKLIVLSNDVKDQAIFVHLGIWISLWKKKRVQNDFVEINEINPKPQTLNPIQ